MKEWKDILVELAKKLTPPLAFGILFVVVLSQFGGQIPQQYINLVYDIGVGVPILWAAFEIYRVWRSHSAAPQTGSHSVLSTGKNSQITYIVNNYAQNVSGISKTELETQLKEYLDWVHETFGTIILRGIAQGRDSAVILPLETVYVPLAAEFTPERDELNIDLVSERRRGEIELLTEQSQRSTKINLNQILSISRRLIVTGGPGSGKTTVLQHIAWAFAHAIQTGKLSIAKEKLGVEPPLPFPIYVPLSLYAAYLRDLPKTAKAKERQLATFISEYLLQRQMHLTLSPDFIAHLLREEKSVILLLDGLDEVPNEEERIRVRQAIEDLVAGRENLRVIVTSRTAAYQGNAVLGRGFRHIRVLPLDWDNVKELVIHAYRSIHSQSEAQAKEKAQNLLTDIANLEEARKQRLGEDVEPFVDSPLMVRMLLIVHFNNRKLPDQRADLYLKAVDAMLRPDYNPDQSVSEEIEHRVAGSLAMNREMLQYLAYHMHRKGNEQGREIAEETLHEILKQESTYAPFVNELIAQTRQRGTLLEERGGLYRFIHLSFQEFLVGRYFVENVRDLDKIAEELEDGLSLDSWWREPILLTIGYLDLTAPVMARRLILRLAGAEAKYAKQQDKLSLDARLASAEIAASAYLECKAQSPDLAAILKERLLDLREQGKTQKWTPVIMASAADTLDELGYLPDDLYEFARVEQVGNLFDIAKHPVVNLQYKLFLDAEDFHAEKYWTKFPKYSEPDENGECKLIGDWGGEGYEWLKGNWDENKKILPRYWNDPRFGIARRTAPVVEITWWEANAFCKWLTEHWQEIPEYAAQAEILRGKIIRLPTETEWVLAAGGLGKPLVKGKGKLYRFAWDEKDEVTTDEKEILRRANVGESGINRTTPAGMYPLGRTKETGIWDMSGNVWEWQTNFYDKDRDWLGLRGGSWSFNEVNARLAYRNFNPPNGEWLSSGFRLVVCSPPS
ncbi:MAG: NACHT domain-containing protein [Chloroflexota bacterium]